MKELILVFIILFSLFAYNYIHNNQENFISKIEIKRNNNIILSNNNKIFTNIIKYLFNINTKVLNDQERKYINNILSIKDFTQTKYGRRYLDISNIRYIDINNILNLILMVFIIRRSTNNKISKNKLKHLLNYYFGPYSFINNQMKVYPLTGTSIQIPIDILNKIDWELYDKILDSINTKNIIHINDVLQIKKNIIVQQFINNQIPIIRNQKIYDQKIYNYGLNYINLINNDKMENYGTNEIKNDYKDYNYNLYVDILLSIYNYLQLQNKNNKIVYNEMYKNLLSINSYPLLVGNIYLPSEKYFIQILNNLQKEIKREMKTKKKYPLTKNWNYTGKNFYLSNILSYPLRFQYPLDHNCQRIWYNCSSKDRINDYYNYYDINHNNNIYSSTSGKNQMKFSLL